MEDKKTLPFNGTPEQEAELLKVINEGKTEKGALMAIMQKDRTSTVISRLRFRPSSQESWRFPCRRFTA